MMTGQNSTVEMLTLKTRGSAYQKKGQYVRAIAAYDTAIVSGRKISSFGGENKFGEKARGMLIAARADAQVTSPVDGWVAYADEFRTYGQLLIINAGGGYHILLAGMRRIDVGEGQFVLAGEPVAVMGGATRAGSGQAGGPRQALYIEFRKDGRSIDPSPWWAKSSERVQG